jgi:hypothetical protein
MAAPSYAANVAPRSLQASQNTDMRTGLVAAQLATLGRNQCPDSGHMIMDGRATFGFGTVAENQLSHPSSRLNLGRDTQTWVSGPSDTPTSADLLLQQWTNPEHQAPYEQEANAHSYITASSQPSMSTLTASSTPTRPGLPAPTFTCLVDGCGLELPVDLSTLKQHLVVIHGYPASRRGHVLECRWTTCECKSTGCKGRPGRHGVHGEDIARHIWEHHLSFQDPCSKCGILGWARSWCKTRHEHTCKGRKPARCRKCGVLFTSEAALGGHLELDRCPERMKAVVSP